MEGTPACWSSATFNEIHKEKHRPCDPGLVDTGLNRESDFSQRSPTAMVATVAIVSCPKRFQGEFLSKPWTRTHPSIEPNSPGEFLTFPGEFRSGHRDSGTLPRLL
ncbi:hypothetical protein BH11ARM1_BH11ARM1_00230 [soil metagenome]